MTENLDSAWALLRSLRVGDFVRSRELPPHIIASIDTLVDAFVAGDSDEKLRINREVEYTFSFAFFLYAGRAAVESVRRNRPELLRRGLGALAIENLIFDARDSLREVAKLYNSAQKFPQLDPDEVFRSVASTSTTPFNEALSGFIQRSGASKSLARFGLQESTPPTPFNYEVLGKELKRSSRLHLLLRRLRRLPGLRQILGY